MSNNTMLFGLYRMGWHSRATVHGFRGVASTLLNEAGFNRDWIERQLAHDERDEVQRTISEEFAGVCRTGISHPLDVHRGLYLQELIQG